MEPTPNSLRSCVAPAIGRGSPRAFGNNRKVKRDGHRFFNSLHSCSRATKPDQKSEADYRKVYRELSEAFNVEFVFADEKITSLHILQKIVNYIRSSRFGLYDISGWNANVTLELGLAFGLNEKAFIAIDPAKTDISEVPSDLRGIDRIQYGSYSELQEGLAKLLAQELPVQPTHDVENQLTQLRQQILKLISDSEGLGVNDIATLLGVSVDMAKLVVRPMVGDTLERKGKTRGAKYYRKGSLPTA